MNNNLKFAKADFDVNGKFSTKKSFETIIVDGVSMRRVCLTLKNEKKQVFSIDGKTSNGEYLVIISPSGFKNPYDAYLIALCDTEMKELFGEVRGQEIMELYEAPIE